MTPEEIRKIGGDVRQLPPQPGVKKIETPPGLVKQLSVEETRKLFAPIRSEPGPGSPPGQPVLPDPQVWADQVTKVYYRVGSQQYGRISGGRVMSEAEALARGFRPATPAIR